MRLLYEGQVRKLRTAVAGELLLVEARRTLLASYPRHRVLTRAVSRLQNICFRVIGKRFRSFVYSPSELQRAAAGAGLTQSRVSRGFVWETARYDRAA